MMLIPLHTYAIEAAVLRGSATAENRKTPQTYSEDREGTVVTAI